MTIPDNVAAAVQSDDRSTSNWLKFIIPSTLGAALFLMPVPGGDTWTIPFGVMVDWLNGNFGALLKWALVVVTMASAVLTLWYSYGPGKPSTPMMVQYFRTTAVWTLLRCLGAAFTILYTTGTGPEWIISGATGGTVVGALMTACPAHRHNSTPVQPCSRSSGHRPGSPGLRHVAGAGPRSSGIGHRRLRSPGRASG